jgi:Dolichyl-phosphate-mannose-protein mannosyltransferase
MGLRAARGVRTRATGLTCPQLLALVGAMALAVRLPFMVGPVDGMRVPDSWIYRVIAEDLLHGRGFHRAAELRTPGYPVFVAALAKLPGTLPQTVVVAQHIIGIAVTLAIVWAAWRYFGRGAAVVTGILAATSPVLVNLEGDVMPDFLLGALILVGALLLARALEGSTPSLRLIAAAGVVFGLAALVKPVGQALVLTALVPFLVYPRDFGRAARAGALLVACLLITISPWLVRNVVVFGNVRMSDQDGPALWLREFDWDRRPIPTNTAEGRLTKRLYDETVGREPGAHPTDTYEFVLEALENKPYFYSEQEATGIQRRVALQAIREAPRLYAFGTVSIMKRLATPASDRYWARVTIDAKRHEVRPTLSTEFSMRVFALARYPVKWWTILSLELLAIFLLPFTRSHLRRVGVFSFGVAYLAIEGATAATAFPDPRYASQAEGLLWIVGSAAVALVVGALATRVRAALRGPRDTA